MEVAHRQEASRSKIAKNYICGVHGLSRAFEGFSTSTYERDGTLWSSNFLVGDGTDQKIEAVGKYKLIPIDENTLYGNAATYLYFVTETWV